MAGRVALVVAVFLLAQVWAEEPERCCWISQMNGNMELRQNKQLEDGQIIVKSTSAFFAYDKISGLKSFIFKETFDNGTQRIARIVDDYYSGVSYLIVDNQGEQTCLRKYIPARFPLNCIPEEAQFAYNASLGDHALSVNYWQLNQHEGGYLYNRSYTLAAEYCVPIDTNYVRYNFNTNPPEVNLVSVTYDDMKLGICDRDRFFKLPEECQQGDMTPFLQKKWKQRQMMEAPYRVDTFM